jgi:hypothetical protein
MATEGNRAHPAPKWENEFSTGAPSDRALPGSDFS